MNDIEKLRSSLSKEVKELKKEIKTKASKEAVIDGQQAFFEDLNQVESQADKKREKLIIEEFKRVGDKLVAENARLEDKLVALEKQLNPNALKQMLDAKMDKEEFANFVSILTEETIHPMQKEIDKCKKDIVCIEVSLVLTISKA
jgi:hypothetical protein